MFAPFYSLTNIVNIRARGHMTSGKKTCLNNIKQSSSIHEALFKNTKKRDFSAFSLPGHIKPGPDLKPLYLDSSNLDWIIPESQKILYNTVSDL